VALLLVVAPVSSVGHAAAPESSHHAAAAAAAQDQGASPNCGAEHGDKSEKSARTVGADCCLSSCHVVSGPVAGSPGDARPVEFPRSAELGFADARAPSGLLLKPPLDPPRSDA